MGVGEIFDNDRDGLEYHHEAGDGFFEVATDGIFEAFDLNVGLCGGDAEFVDKGEDGAGGNTTASGRFESEMS